MLMYFTFAMAGVLWQPDPNSWTAIFDIHLTQAHKCHVLDGQHTAQAPVAKQWATAALSRLLLLKSSALTCHMSDGTPLLMHAIHWACVLLSIDSSHAVFQDRKRSIVEIAFHFVHQCVSTCIKVVLCRVWNWSVPGQPQWMSEWVVAHIVHLLHCTVRVLEVCSYTCFWGWRFFPYVLTSSFWNSVLWMYTVGIFIVLSYNQAVTIVLK